MKFDERGLVPVVVQDERTGEVRMVAYANEEALRRTRETGMATFYSRSRGALWEKGESSGNGIEVTRVLVDCDEDCVLYLGRPRGPSCHTGAATCFFRDVDGAPAEPATILARLEAVLEARKTSTTETSYTKSLYEGGAARIGEKLCEEAGELAAAVAGETDARVAAEAADLLFHALVALRSRGIPLAEVISVLGSRFQTSGHAEKASRAR